MVFRALLKDMDRGLVGPDLAQARRLRAELVEHGLDDPRRLEAVGGDGGQDVLSDVFPGEVVCPVVKNRFDDLWAAVGSAAGWERRRRYDLVSERW